MGLKQSRQKELYDQKTKGAPFKTDDLVWLFCPAVPRGKPRKFHCPWQGPYRVVKPISEVLYQISPQGSKRKQMIVHFDRLKPYHARQMPRDIPDRSESSASEESGYEADAEETNDDNYVILQDDSQSHSSSAASVPGETDSSEGLATPDQAEEQTSLRQSTRSSRPPERYGVFISH